MNPRGEPKISTGHHVADQISTGPPGPGGNQPPSRRGHLTSVTNGIAASCGGRPRLGCQAAFGAERGERRTGIPAPRCTGSIGPKSVCRANVARPRQQPNEVRLMN